MQLRRRGGGRWGGAKGEERVKKPELKVARFLVIKGREGGEGKR